MKRAFWKILKWLITGIILVCIIFASYKIYQKKFYIWLPEHIVQQFEAEEKCTLPQHIIFMIADHFEPGGDIP
ncbi:MAG: hypothetical protein MUO85_09675, partial [candidate division Zixibacteria bacterium]|nr:hypothetical protein [candidate division Zixibacteria bacterium]